MNPASPNRARAGQQERPIPDDHRTPYLEYTKWAQDQRRAGRDGLALHREAGEHRQGRAIRHRFREDQPEQQDPRDRRPGRPRRRADQHLRIRCDLDLSRREDRKVLAGRFAPAGAGARVVDVADGRFWPDTRPGAPFPADRQRAGSPLWSRAILQGDPPALRRPRSPARRGRVRGRRDFNRRLRDPRLGLAP